MKYLLIILVTFTQSACTVQKSSKKQNENIELLKEVAYCKCLEHAMEMNKGKDTSDISLASVLERMDSKGLSSKFVYPVLDSSAKLVVLTQYNSQFENEGKHENAWNKNNYILSCLEFYKSQRLDSLVRSFKIETYTVDIK